MMSPLIEFYWVNFDVVSYEYEWFLNKLVEKSNVDWLVLFTYNKLALALQHSSLWPEVRNAFSYIKRWMDGWMDFLHLLKES